MVTSDIGIVVVTGAGRGLGRALALELVQRECTVAGIGLTLNSLISVRHDSSNLGRFLPFKCDVSDPSEVRAVFTAIRKIGPIAVLINNAAVYPRRLLMDETTETFMKSVAVNLGGSLSCSLCALEDMKHQGRGRILNVSTFADAFSNANPDL